MVLFKSLIVLLFSALTCGCYHLRVNPEPLPVKKIISPLNSAISVRIIKRILDSELNARILDEMDNGTTLITSPIHFATDTRLGMPIGGRKYYVQLRFEIEYENNHCVINISPYNYDLRTSYAFGLDGQVKTLYKIYPYTEYPGMFDLNFLENELQKITIMLENSLKDLQ